jgi:transposase InsO family protein
VKRPGVLLSPSFRSAEKVNRKLKSGDVLNALAEVIPQRGVPKYLRSDNGSEFIAREVQDWFQELGVGTIYIDPGSLWQNEYVEPSGAR